MGVRKKTIDSVASTKPGIPGVEGASCEKESSDPNIIQKQMTKTKFCKFFAAQGSCPYADGCTFAHSVSELHQAPDLKKTRLCVNFRDGACHVDNCPFAHGNHELRATTHCYKKTMCRWFEKGCCTVGDMCRFAHGIHEMPILQQDELQELANRRQEDPAMKPKGRVAVSSPATTSTSGNSNGSESRSNSSIITPPSSVDPPTSTSSAGGAPSGYCTSSSPGTSRRCESSSSGSANSAGHSGHESPPVRKTPKVRDTNTHELHRGSERRSSQHRTSQHRSRKETDTSTSAVASEFDQSFPEVFDALKFNLEYVVHRAENLKSLLENVTTSIQQKQLEQQKQQQQQQMQMQLQDHQMHSQQHPDKKLCSGPPETQDPPGLSGYVMTLLTKNIASLAEQLERLEARMDSQIGPLLQGNDLPYCGMQGNTMYAGLQVGGNPRGISNQHAQGMGAQQYLHALTPTMALAHLFPPNHSIPGLMAQDVAWQTPPPMAPLRGALPRMGYKVGA